MDNEEMDDGINKEQEKFFEEFRNKIREMTAVALMCANAPKDQNGNNVVSVVGIKNFGIFYLFEN
jgi:hypothetical protein